jgi:hypothetical protein
MTLFPYERELVEGMGFEIAQKQLEGYGAVDILYCGGVCERNTRPLACRIFPLAPKIAGGELYVRMDPRARSVCPLSHKSILSFDKEFTNIIKKTLNMLCVDDKIFQYLKAVSDIADKYNNIF